MKAFIVTENCDEWRACVRFAEHAVFAQREGANELDADIDDVSCRRAPQFDAYAEAGEVPAHVLVANGWWFECMRCSQQIRDEPTDEDGEPIELTPVYESRGWVFCSQKCRDALHAEKAEQKSWGEAAAAAALAKWPGIEIRRTNGYERPARVWFMFPGAQGEAHWRDGDSTLHVQQRDHQAWMDFAASLRSQ